MTNNMPSDPHDAESGPSKGAPVPQGTQPPDPPLPEPGADELKKLKSAQRLSLMATVFGPVSLLIGGMLLSGIGFACAVVSRKRLNALMQSASEAGRLAAKLQRTVVVSIVVCAVAFVLNAISAWLMYPVLVETLSSGDYASILGSAGTDAGSTGSGTGSTWG